MHQARDFMICGNRPTSDVVMSQRAAAQAPGSSSSIAFAG